jgi:hypothetical protein
MCRVDEPLAVQLVGALDVGGDEVVLGSVQPVERGRGDAGISGDLVNAGGANAVPVEQISSNRKNMFASLICSASSGYLPWMSAPLGSW